MSEAKAEKLFTFSFEQDDEGLNIRLGGTFGKSLDSLKKFATSYCCCGPCRPAEPKTDGCRPS